MLPTKFQVSWPFGSGETKNRFTRWRLWRPAWIINQNNSSCFFIYKSPWYFLASLKSIGLLVQEKKRKIDFQDGPHGSHLGFLIGMILAIYDLQVTAMLPTKFKVNWPFCWGEEAKNRFSRWRPWRPSWISNQNIFSCFWCTSPLMLPTKFQVNWPFGSGEEAKNSFSRWTSWISNRNDD